MNAEEVLDFIVRNQESLNWLANDGRQHIADARLSVFRSDQHFAVFTEFPYFSYNRDELRQWRVGRHGSHDAIEQKASEVLESGFDDLGISREQGRAALDEDSVCQAK